MFIRWLLKYMVFAILYIWAYKCSIIPDQNKPIQLFNVGLYPKPGDIPVLNRKIFRGQRVTVHEHPYMASIRRDISHYSCGVIISKNIVITTAHPLHDVPITQLGVVVGEIYSDRGSKILTVVLKIVHEDFNPYTLQADLAMLRVYESIFFRLSVKPILGLIRPFEEELKGQHAFVTGWGRCDLTGAEYCLPRSSRFYPHEIVDPMLKRISINMPDDRDSCEAYKRQFELNTVKGTLCAGTPREVDPVAPCMAVPSAPLVVNARLLGLQSWGFGCGYMYDLPIVYTDLRHYYPWLDNNTSLLYKVKTKNLLPLFEATAAIISCKYHNASRIFNFVHENYGEEDLQPSEVDKMLAGLSGVVYDVRDFICRGKYHKEKQNMYTALKVMLNTQKSLDILYSEITKFSTTLKPFIRVDNFGDFNSLDQGNYVNETSDHDAILKYDDGDDTYL